MIDEKKALLEQLPRHGWEVISIETDELDWWADEIWKIRSVWDSECPELFVTFLIDPQADTRGGKRTRDIWGVRASLERPTQWQGEEGVVYWGDGPEWRTMLADFMGKLPDLAKSGRGTTPRP